MLISAINFGVEVTTTAKRNLSHGNTQSLVATTTGNTSISQYGKNLSEASDGGSSVRAVMSGYDLHNISYSDLVAMANKLKDIGALKEEDYLDFIGPSPEYGDLAGERVVDWNAPKDYVAMREQQVAFLRASGAESRFIDFANYHLSLYRHFDSMHS